MIGVHVTTGSRNGYGSVAPKCAVIVAITPGAFDEAGANTFKVYRPWQVYGPGGNGSTENDIFPTFEQDTLEMMPMRAAQWWPLLLAKVKETEGFHGKVDAIQLTNEIAGNDAYNIQKLIAYETALMPLAESEGYTLCVANNAPNSPHWGEGKWHTYYVPHIQNAWARGHIYSRHVYFDLFPEADNFERMFWELDHLRSVGLTGPVLVTELGYVTYPGAAQLIDRVDEWANKARLFSEIGGGAIFTYGDWVNANIQNASPELAVYLGAGPLKKWVPTYPVAGNPTPPPIDPPPGEDKPKIVILKKPQMTDMTKAENDKANDYAWNNYGRTTTHSVDDTIRMLSGGNEESYAIVAYPKRLSQNETFIALGQGNYNWVVVPELNEPDANDFVLANPLPRPLSVNYPFNHVRDYGLHEGIDLFAVSNDVVKSGAAGVVTSIRASDPGTGYGRYVRVTHDLDGVSYHVWYCHLNHVDTALWTAVSKGQQIGRAGSTGNSTAPHLHITVQRIPGGLPGYVVDSVIDPAPLLGLPPTTLPGNQAQPIKLMDFMIADPHCWRVVRHPNGSQEDIQDMIVSPGKYVRRKGNNGEWWAWDTQFFYLLHDTSPDVGSEGVPRVYTITKGGLVGAPKNPVTMALGQAWQESGTHTVQFRAKSDCRNLSENSGSAQNNATLFRHEKDYTFNTYGQSIKFDEVVWLKTGVETQIYGRINGKPAGWIGWSAPWGESEPVEIHWNRGTLTTEPNKICSF